MLLDQISTSGSPLKCEENVPFPWSLCVGGEDESLLFENPVERERRWAKEGTTTRPSKGRSLSEGGDDAFIVDSGGSPAVGARCRKPAGYWQHLWLPIILTASSARRKESGICQQKIRKVRIRWENTFLFGDQGKPFQPGCAVPIPPWYSETLLLLTAI